MFSVALSRGLRRVGVTNHRALPSSDFPPARRTPDRVAAIRSSADRAIATPTPSSLLYESSPNEEMARGKAQDRGNLLPLQRCPTEVRGNKLPQSYEKQDAADSVTDPTLGRLLL